MNYPEHEKLENISEESNFIGEFIEWLQTTDRCIAKRAFDNFGKSVLIEDNTSVNSLLSEMFRIDLVKLEEEKRIMLDSIKLG